MKHMKVSPFEKKQKISTLHVQKKSCKIFWYTPTAGSKWKASGLQNKLCSTSAPNLRSSSVQFDDGIRRVVEAPVQDEQHFDELPFGGYDFVFVDEPSPGQTCSICLTAMRNPVQTFCGHRFCEECLVGTFR